MARVSFFSILLFLSTIQGLGQNQKQQAQIDTFENYLGNKKVEAINYAINVFENFLQLNFPQKSQKNAYLTYAKVLADGYNEPKPDWKTEGVDIKGMMHKLEVSGMRKELLLFPDTTYIDRENGVYRYRYRYDGSIYSSNIPSDHEDWVEIKPPSGHPRYGNQAHPISVDSAMKREERLGDLNYYGAYFEVLRILQSNDSLIKEYVLNFEYTRDIAPSIIASAYVVRPKLLDSYVFKRIFVINLFYYPLLIDPMYLKE